MLHRILAICIVAFWLAMSSLLVVRELFPESTGLNAVPLSYVGHIVFQHEQSSDLQVVSGGKVAGNVTIQPRNVPATSGRSVIVSGSIEVPMPDKRTHRIGWNAEFELAQDYALRRLTADISPPGQAQQVRVLLDLVAKEARIGTRLGKEVVNETHITLDEAGLGSLTMQAGIDPSLVRQFAAARGGLPEFTFGAQSSSIKLGGQKLATFLLTMKAGGETVIEAHLSQLGQILHAQAPQLGLKLQPFNLPR